MSSVFTNGVSFIVHTFTNTGISNLSFSAGGIVDVLVLGGRRWSGKGEPNPGGDGAGGGGGAVCL